MLSSQRVRQPAVLDHRFKPNGCRAGNSLQFPVQMRLVIVAGLHRRIGKACPCTARHSKGAQSAHSSVGGWRQSDRRSEPALNLAAGEIKGACRPAERAVSAVCVQLVGQSCCNRINRPGEAVAFTTQVGFENRDLALKTRRHIQLVREAGPSVAEICKSDAPVSAVRHGRCNHQSSAGRLEPRRNDAGARRLFKIKATCHLTGKQSRGLCGQIAGGAKLTERPAKMHDDFRPPVGQDGLYRGSRSIASERPEPIDDMRQVR